ncbi:uncharacterized protein AB675_5627 [Cyphellophora attinorum]|uniref:Uncharacterized protein n=1 Tax=Cyphellophora attinorum TaxID=1664694 RepID=A0A0N1H749_9EURO|nr:uncharacterized protein AB675_5627 [Phialophora attinorum]KPI42142.1 hypothetical protein AB675_5627 [Phialophora attinorum]
MLPLVMYLICMVAPFTLANTEKVIFVTPEAQDFVHDASLDNLLLERLTSANFSLRTYVNATFPTEDAPKGTETWLLLEDLTPNQRHEVRICWLATQPTSFWLYTHTMVEVFSDPTLLSAVTDYSNRRRRSISSAELDEFRSRSDRRAPSSDRPSTFLFLQIHAAADYFSLNDDLMKNVPPVHADIILDPYLLNIFPQSLVPTAVYIVIIAIIGWFVSGWIYSNLIHPLLAEEPKPAKKAE